MTDLNYSDYDTPNAVVKDKTLSREEKVSFLKKWKADEEALQRATSEGLNGGETSELRDVQKALDSLSEATSA